MTVNLDESTVLEWFVRAAKSWKTDEAYVLVPMIDGLPSDAKVHCVRTDSESASICFVVESDEFQEVPAGNIIPAFSGLAMRFESVLLAIKGSG